MPMIDVYATAGDAPRPHRLAGDTRPNLDGRSSRSPTSSLFRAATPRPSSTSSPAGAMSNVEGEGRTTSGCRC